MGVAVLDNDVRAPVFEGGDRTAQGRAEDDEGHGQREVAERDRAGGGPKPRPCVTIMVAPAHGGEILAMGA